MSERINSNERGAALLFAMGLLALFLLLAMAFAANSLLQRKIAANRSSRSMVEVIADSATERVRTMLFYYQGNVNSTWIDGKADVNRLGSYIDDTDTDEKKLDGGEVAADLLEVQKLGGVLYEENDYKQCPYVMAGIAHNTATCPICSNWQLPDWRLVKNRQTASVDEIVGRYAYVMLPPTPRYFVDRDADNLPVWHTFEELFSGLTTKNKDNLRTAKREVEIYYPPALEAYVCNTVSSSILPRRPLPEEFFKRFNLNRSDWDTVTVDNLLTSDPVHFYQGTGSGSSFTLDWTTNKLLPDTATLENGIQFLRRVGNDKATFASLAERRQQIAANLIDYCDTDNIPTSESTTPPNQWDGATKPDVKYAGNEGTPYIDRLGAAVNYLSPPQAVAMPSGFESFLSTAEQNLLNHMASTDSTSMFASGAFLRIDIQAAFVGGLVKMYPNDLSDNYALQVFLDGDGLRVKNKVSGGTLTFFYQYEVMEAGIPVTKDGGGQVTLNPSWFSATADELYFKQPSVSNNFIRFCNPTTTDGDNGKVILPFKKADFQTNGYAAVKSDRVSSGGSMVPMQTYAYISVLPFLFKDSNAVAFLGHLQGTGGTYIADTFRWTSWVPGDIVLEQADLPISRMVLSDLGSSEWGTAPDTSVSKQNVDYVNGFSVAYDLGNTTIGGTDPQGLTFALGGIFCRDPRQNLFPADWYKNSEFKIGSYSDIASLLGLNTGNVFNTASLVPDPQCGSGYPDRNPASGPDQESVTTPAWAGNAANQHLSTAFFRNAPMKSLAELGFIHRGAKWETLNLANAAQPNSDAANVSQPVLPSDYDPVTYKYDLTTVPGTSYQQGDGGLLDQVKVTDKNFLYDSYDLNLRDGSGALNDKFIGDEYYWRLLKGIRLGALQTAGADVDAIGSQSDGTAVTDLKNGANTVIADALISRLNWKYETDQTNAPPVYSNRAQMLWYPNNGGRFFDAYTTLTGANANSLDINKALHDELNAKTMEHTTAGGLPTVYRVLVLAQSIRDIGADSSDLADGFSISMDTDGDGTISGSEHYTQVLLGKYEPGADEITGQLRMVVTFVRDPATGKVLIKDIEYLED